ncbi:protein phosphatase 1 regulatory subunit 15B [Chanos chanos]|uniref:Protein phosphatase 1 regulatory subunit 15B n=1 Tax=Chanos chanos TaxID=29144 RepID=A0A6J2W8M7_CHACN|nr:protein phosphatase 1 regulatory subunit 15B-like [Chanos chanos]
METIADTKRKSEKTAMQRFGDSGMMLLPWTKQMLSVLWEHLRLLVHVICYSLMTVFQMFRLEVHLRITDETGQHVQHMTSATGNPTENFLSSLFENNKNVIVAGSKPLTKLSGDFAVSSHSRSLLSSFVSDDLCCSLVDDFVSRATECLSEDEDLFIGPHSSWKNGFDWDLFVGSETERVKDKGIASKTDFTAYVPSFTSQSETCQNQEDCNPENDCDFSMCSSEDSQVSCSPHCREHRSDSENSWTSSDGSCAEGDKEENDRLWELLSTSTDPYHPLHFTACAPSTVSKPERPQTGCLSVQSSQNSSVVPSCGSPNSDTTEKETTGPFSSEEEMEEDEEEALWRSLTQNNDPYHPLNFRAPLLTAELGKTRKDLPKQRSSTPLETENCVYRHQTARPVIKHNCLQALGEKPSLVPWRKHGSQNSASSHKKDIHIVKKVKFSPVVQVHKMQAWSFAMQASRKGPWEELARDRERFQRRIQKTEQAIGYCISPSHREMLFAYQQSTQTKPAVLTD